MKKLSLLFCCLCWSIIVLGQHELNKVYHIYMTDGSFLKCELITEDETSIQVKLAHGELLTIPLTHIEKISQSKKNQTLFPKGYTLQTSGPYNIITTGALVGKESNFDNAEVISYSLLSYIHGYQFNKYFAMGGGTSLDFYDDGFLPIYADFRGYIFNKKNSLYYSVNAGYAFAFDQFKRDKDDAYFKGGIMIHPALGVRFATKQNYSFLMELGYRFQFAKREYPWNEFTDEIIYKRLALRIGFLF